MLYGPDSGYVEYLRLATAGKRHEAKRAENGDRETSGRGSGVAERTREDFGEVRKSEAWREPIQGRQTDDLQSGQKDVLHLPWFASLARVSLCDRASRAKLVCH